MKAEKIGCGRDESLAVEPTAKAQLSSVGLPFEPKNEFNNAREMKHH
jgi:hypothetical protein